MIDFKNVKITDEIIVVEKINYRYDGTKYFKDISQGYIVDPNNKQMLKVLYFGPKVILEKQIKKMVGLYMMKKAHM